MYDNCQTFGHLSLTVLKVDNPLQVSNHALTEENWIDNYGQHSHQIQIWDNSSIYDLQIGIQTRSNHCRQLHIASLQNTFFDGQQEIKLNCKLIRILKTPPL